MNEQDVQQAKSKIEAAKSHNDLEALRLEYLGRKGAVTSMLAGVGKLPLRERAKAGAKANQVRGEIEAALADQKAALSGAASGSNQPIDLTAPVPAKYGHAHPVNQVTDEIIKVFWQMGYGVVDGPEVESDWYNFEALNMPEEHPARAMQDTFYLEEGNLPRTHTSGMQVRYMEANKPPIRIISPGKVYRNEDEDARHGWMFYQVEGLVVDKGVTLGDLKGTLLAMMQGVLGKDTQLRLRPSYFPYTEPSVEMDATCIVCGGKGGDCKTCSGTGWLELGGAGMVHPDVLKRVNIDPEVYSGFAFGFGSDRIAMLKYGVPDIREFWRPNLKFLRQL